MSGRAKSEESLKRWRQVFELKRQRYSQRAIARQLGISLSTVQWYLKQGPPPPRAPRMVLTKPHEPLVPAGGDPLMTQETPRWPVTSGSPKKRRKPGIATVTDIGTKRAGA